MVQPRQPSAGPQVKLTVKVTLRDIYAALCPVCKEELLRLFTGKAESAAAGALREQFEAPVQPEPEPAVGPNEHS